MESYLKLLGKLNLRQDYGTSNCFMVMIADCDKETIEPIADSQIIVMRRTENVDDMLCGMHGINLLAVFSDKGDDLSKEQYDQIEELSKEARSLMLPFSFFGDKEDFGVYMFDIRNFLRDGPNFKDEDGYEIWVDDVVNIGEYMYAPHVLFEVYSKEDNNVSLGRYCLPLPKLLERVTTIYPPETSDCYVVNV